MNLVPIGDLIGSLSSSPSSPSPLSIMIAFATSAKPILILSFKSLK